MASVGLKRMLVVEPLQSIIETLFGTSPFTLRKCPSRLRVTPLESVNIVAVLAVSIVLEVLQVSGTQHLSLNLKCVLTGRLILCSVCLQLVSCPCFAPEWCVPIK